MEINRSNGKIKGFIKKNLFEQIAWSNNLTTCGIDEVGRGCLAGPLVSAAVILPPGKLFSSLKDSKVLTEQQRLQVYAWITQNCWHGIGIVDNYAIDRQNIWHATLVCMKKALLHALAACPLSIASILTDAMPLQLFDTEYSSVPVYFFDKGESKSSSIAAASIVAKVKRDAIMKKLNVLFPGFGLDEHKGYGTVKHKGILRRQSPLIIHRKSFLNHIDIDVDDKQKEKCYEQQSIIAF